MLKFFAATNRGKVRENNEDYYYIPGEVPNLFILADGMGGHLAGEIASQLAVFKIVEYFKNLSDKDDISQSIISAIKVANNEIYRAAKEDSHYRGMGTTLSLVYFKDEKMYYTNVGDSRIYKINNDIVQITKDDSFVNYLIEIGDITEEEAKAHPKKNVVTKALGTSENIDVSVKEMEVTQDDVILLCSDGLTDMVDCQKLFEIIKNDFNNSSEKLIEEALENGGIDNITLVIIGVGVI